MKPGIVVIGGSAGSLSFVLNLLPKLNTEIRFPIVLVFHRKNSSDSTLTSLIASKTKLHVKEVEEKDEIQSGRIFIAPADYHPLLEKNHSFSLDLSEKILFSRPSIDVTFQSAAEVYRENTIAILLSGANNDGTKGLEEVKKHGGITVVQDPKSAEVPFMPTNALENVPVDLILDQQGLTDFLNELH